MRRKFFSAKLDNHIDKFAGFIMYRAQQKHLSVPEPEGRGDWYRKLPFAKRYCLGGARILAERGGEGVGGGPGGKVRGPGWTGDQTCRSLSVCLSVTGRTSPSCLGQSSRNFRWWSESWSGTFISGSGQIAQL